MYMYVYIYIYIYIYILLTTNIRYVETLINYCVWVGEGGKRDSLFEWHYVGQKICFR